jgi:hypothetical protein
MAIAIEIAEVLEQVAFRLHLPAFDTGEFVTSTSALALAKSSVSRLSALLTRLYGDRYFANEARLSVQTGVGLSSLPDKHLTLLGVHLIQSDKAYELRPTMGGSYSPLPVAWGASVLPTYRLEGNVLTFTPINQNAEQIRVTYEKPLTISAVDEIIYGNPGWDEWLVLDICEQIRDREDKDASRFTQRKYVIEEQLKSQASQRDRNGLLQVVDARGANSRWDIRRSRRCP